MVMVLYFFKNSDVVVLELCSSVVVYSYGLYITCKIVEVVVWYL